MTDEQMLGPTAVSFESPTGEIAVHDDWEGNVTVGLGIPRGELYVLKNPEGTVTVQIAWEIGEQWYGAGSLLTRGSEVAMENVKAGPCPTRRAANEAVAIEIQKIL